MRWKGIWDVLGGWGSIFNRSTINRVLPLWAGGPNSHYYHALRRHMECAVHVHVGGGPITILGGTMAMSLAFKSFGKLGQRLLKRVAVAASFIGVTRGVC